MDSFVNENNIDEVKCLDAPVIPSYFSDTCNLNLEQSLAISHVNVRSLNKNFEEFKLLYEDLLTEKFKIIGVSETWNMTNSNMFNLNFYALEFNCREIGRGGGVAAYIHSSVKYKILSFRVLHTESLCLQIFDKKYSYIIGIMYRKPNTSITEFENSLLEVLDSIKLDKTHCILIGDLNMDFSKQDSVEQFYTKLLCLDLKQLILTPTRITNTSKTTIDHIYTNINHCSVCSGTIVGDISDHLPVFAIFENIYTNSSMSQTDTVSYRSYKNFSLDKFRQDLSIQPWNEVYMHTDDANEAYNSFCLNFYRML